MPQATTHSQTPSATQSAAAHNLQLVVISHRNGTNHELARDENDALNIVHKWVREWWPYEAKRQVLPAAMPDDPADATEMYFDQVPDEGWEITNIKLP